MKRYSIAPSSSRRKSAAASAYNDDSAFARQELERLEQETTLVLQEIDKNISRANSVINDRLIPVIKDYSSETRKVWNNAGFWKYFFEHSANVELNSYEDPINTNTDVNTIANTGNNLLFDDDEKEEEIVDANDEYENDNDRVDELPVFKRPLVNHGSIVYATDPQTNIALTARYDPSESIGLQIPPMLTATLSSSEATNTNSRSPVRRTRSPSKTQTLRQSLDAYHRVSISPRKIQTPLRTYDEVRRRSSMIRELINSSPTLPEPPILQSEIGNSPPPVSHNSKDSAQSAAASSRDVLSPVLIESVYSPAKSIHSSAHRKGAASAENTIQRFPSTPKFVERLSGGAGVDIMRTPFGTRLRYGDDSDLQPPELQNDVPLSSTMTRPSTAADALPVEGSSKRKSGGTEGSSKRPRPLETNDDNENVFLDSTNKNVSAGSTVYHSILQQERDKSRDNTNHSQSRSISQVFDDVIARISGKRTDTNVDEGQAHDELERANGPEVNDIFKEVSGTQEDASLQDHTGNSTSELGPLRERWRNINGL
ncbi:DASH complex subunit ask1 (Outer kinetochore protein ASK1) (Associated with spindles and kinetochores protein 1) [Scheffersomyces stipitis CBS 6054]|uniref:DASH complex subunit ASK1 n=1 Tax=Scheffersomyces stipitis (strain ATCC 58785 / CBS 6054 / NBRC 10063 / NRRL Y-11545) TaxID=322104 RepID=A3GG83_PICST|nr:DASH complex subunit ask1 (Outer kinetochore protein ASK1) (Associated with spindles and kinetochores protein 1) [Scheffersomyces stipitis CBS 6054]EAZ63472.2 DASH complex subunit ask1 (Outer kinetochore protein ASK1) (Associated with spindles and kinetochores protein 1) [Scheffersomyces stipitis CBS 6054]